MPSHEQLAVKIISKLDSKPLVAYKSYCLVLTLAVGGKGNSRGRSATLALEKAMRISPSTKGL
jgi:hypothetical protein